MKKKVFYALVLLVGSLLILLSYFVGTEEGAGARFSVLIYGILVTVFLAAQLWGFVVSQVVYVAKVERAKYELLEIEGIACEANKKIS